MGGFLSFIHSSPSFFYISRLSVFVFLVISIFSCYVTSCLLSGRRKWWYQCV
jgi:hypothetical protein